VRHELEIAMTGIDNATDPFERKILGLAPLPKSKVAGPADGVLTFLISKK